MWGDFSVILPPQAIISQRVISNGIQLSYPPPLKGSFTNDDFDSEPSSCIYVSKGIFLRNNISCNPRAQGSKYLFESLTLVTAAFDREDS